VSGPVVDALSRFVFEGAAVRGAFVTLDDTCREILACHRYPRPLARVLAELLAAAALLASTLAFKGSLIVELRGDGPVRLLVVECDATLALRATAQWNAAAEALPDNADLATLAGGDERTRTSEARTHPPHGADARREADSATSARLAITLDPRDGGPLYQGIVALETAGVATLIEHYLTRSEQIESRLTLAADARRAHGLLLQRMPGSKAGDDALWARVAAHAARIDPRDVLAARSPARLLSTRFPDCDIRLFDAQPTRFACGCSEERIANALRLLGNAEVEILIAEQGMIGVTCEFCNRHYTFLAGEARALLAEGTARDVAAPDPSPTAPAR